MPGWSLLELRFGLMHILTFKQQQMRMHFAADLLKVYESCMCRYAISPACFADGPGCGCDTFAIPAGSAAAKLHGPTLGLKVWFHKLRRDQAMHSGSKQKNAKNS